MANRDRLIRLINDLNPIDPDKNEGINTCAWEALKNHSEKIKQILMATREKIKLVMEKNELILDNSEIKIIPEWFPSDMDGSRCSFLDVTITISCVLYFKSKESSRFEQVEFLIVFYYEYDQISTPSVDPTTIQLNGPYLSKKSSYSINIIAHSKKINPDYLLLIAGLKKIFK
jgi:hypothetical protein